MENNPQSLKKRRRHGSGNVPRAELSHKGAMIDLFIPMGKDILIKIVDEGFGVGDLHQQCRREQLEIAGQSNLYTEQISCIVNT